MKKILKEINGVNNLYNSCKYIYDKNFVSDLTLIRRNFKKRLNREVELQNPLKFNDKLQWLKLNWHDPKAVICADKYEVRGLVEKRIGETYLNELYGVYTSVNDIDIEKFPRSFVLKGTHGSGFNIICKDKYKMNWKKEFKKMRKWLNKNYYWSNREWVYKDIKPRIICEKYLEEIEFGELRDYKIFCFNGEPKLIEVDFDRFNNHKRNLYDLNWNLLNVEIKYPRDKNENIKKPNNLDKLLSLSKELSSGFPHVRVDFYQLENEIYFGELTFFHGSGMERFTPEIFEEEMGEWLKLPEMSC